MSRRTIWTIVAVIVAINVLIVVVNEIAPGPSGKRSSSLATAPEGFAAWAELARRNGISVVPLRADLDEASLPAGATVVALDVPRLDRSDARALRDFAAAGGHVVAGGRRPGRWLDVLDESLVWRGSGPGAARATASDPATDGVRAVRTAGDGSWGGAPEITEEGGGAAGASGDGVTALAGGDEALLVVDGGVALLADASPLQNERLAEADNAALALNLAGDGPLVFAEAPHGYGESTGLGALPGAAKGALLILLGAALLLMLARGRRFGPPEPTARDLPPPRVQYVDAVGATLARTSDHDGAMAPVREALVAAGVDADDIPPVRDHAGAVELARRLQDTRGRRQL